MTIRLLRFVAFLGCFLLIAASVAVTFVALQIQHDDALVINLAGRQRMLIQRMTLEVLGTQIGTNRVYREDLHNTAHAYFETTLNALINGGSTPYTDGVTVTLPPTRSPQILIQLEAVRANWEEMHAAIHAVLASDPQSPAFAEAVTQIERLSPLMLTQMDEAVQLYESESARKVTQVQSIQFGFLATATLLLIVAFILSERWVLAPLVRLGSAARRMGEGDLATPISVMGPGELSWLARSFDDMRQKLGASREQSAERLERISSLHDIDVAITSSLNLQERLDILLEKVIERLRVDAAAVALIELRTHELVYVARRGLNGEFFQDGLIQVGEGIVGQVARSDQPMVIPNVRIDPRFMRQAAAERFGIVSYIAVPLRTRDETIGVLELATREPHLFPQEEVDFFVTLAGQAAIALQNAQLFTETQQRLHEVSLLLNVSATGYASLRVDEMLPIILDHLLTGLGVDGATALTVDSSAGLVRVQAARGEYEAVAGLTHRLEEMPAACALRSSGGVCFGQNDCPFLPDAGRPLIVACVSFMVGEQTRGGLGIGARRSEAFGEDQIRLLRGAADIAANSLHRAALFDEVRLYKDAFGSTAEGAAITDLQGHILDVNPAFERITGYSRTEALGQKLSLVKSQHSTPEFYRAMWAQILSQGYWAGEIINRRKNGEEWDAFLTISAVKDERGQPVAYVGINRDITEMKSLQREREALFQTEREQRELADVLREAGTSLSATLDFDSVLDRLLEYIGRVVPYDTANVMLLDAQTGHIRVARQRGYEQFGDHVVSDIVALSFNIAATPNLRRMVETGQPFVVPDTATDPDWVKVAASAHVRSWAGAPIIAQGQVIAFFSLDKIEPDFYQPKHTERLAALAGQAALAMQNSQLFESLVSEKRRLELLYHLSQNLTTSLNPREVAERALHLTSGALGAFKGELFVLETDGDRLRLIAVSGYDAESVESLDRRIDLHTGQGLAGHVARTRTVVVVADTAHDEHWLPMAGLDDEVRAAASIPLLAGDVLVGVLNLLGDRVGLFLERDLPLLTAMTAPTALALQNAKLFDETRLRAAELGSLADVSSALRQAQTRDAMMPLLVEKALEALDADAGALILLEGKALVFDAARGPAEVLLGQRHPPGDDPLWQVVNTGQPMFISDVSEHREFGQWEISRAMMAELKACACVPLKTAVTTIGLLHLACRSKRVPTESEVRLLTSIAEMAGNALHRATLHAQTERQLQRLTALHVIDAAISASFDLHLTLNVLLDQITTQLHVDAADILLLNPHTQKLEFAGGRGFRAKAIERSHLQMGEGYAGRAALERQVVHVPDLRSRQTNLLRSPLFGAEGFISTYCVPLIAKGQVKGVLEIFHRTPLESDEEWLNFLESLAAQVAIAIDNAELFEGLQRSNVELAVAYDTTIEGWSHALDLRDKETEGHTQRVTEMAIRLAKAMGISDKELVHLRRGALLHDMGKMGVPDRILLKPGPLTDDEWAIMRQHPQFAYDMLSPIAYVRPALDIPYCHHEKWDGTGYPRGLKGEQIPLAARIFAVVDVWDALRSDRPYREGWAEEKVREYIREQSGKHFDPKVVEAFLPMSDLR